MHSRFVFLAGTSFLSFHSDARGLEVALPNGQGGASQRTRVFQKFSLQTAEQVVYIQVKKRPKIFFSTYMRAQRYASLPIE